MSGNDAELTDPSAPHRVFLSASIPDPERWVGPYDPFAITDAVVAAARAVFTRGGAIVTAAHPTIAPLILQVGDRFPGSHAKTMVVLYQSRLFEGVIPAATLEMMQRSYVDVEWTPAAPGDEPQPSMWAASLASMREAMLSQRSFSAAVFIGGMDGIVDEFEKVGEVQPRAKRFALGRPGGAAAALSDDSVLDGLLSTSDLYPWVMDQIMDQVFPTRPDRR